ncbi:hypothetical protein LIER_24541 [Lithospermum erythrorhizon]|uniref:Retrotransposon gag domain-containing protein n=1 Tax=Lithospermum erythrorhizon TaxID=34254 RepID=A0AAV3R5Q0_LITER
MAPEAVVLASSIDMVAALHRTWIGGGPLCEISRPSASRVYCRAFPSSLAGPALKWFNQLIDGCITYFEDLKKRFTRIYGGRLRQDKDEHSLMTIQQGESEWRDFQTEFNLVPGAD